MQTTFFSRTHLILFCSVFFYGLNCFSQKDTLHIYYKALQPELADSNYNKISEWAKKLNGKRTNVEIYSYYDVSDFKKIMTERAENAQIVVIRKARDFTTIKFCGPVRGKKSQRSVLDIVYALDGYVQPAEVSTSETKKDAKVETPAEAPAKSKKETPLAPPTEVTTKKKKEKPVKKPDEAAPILNKEEEPVRMPDQIYTPPEKKVEEETKPTTPEVPEYKEPEKETKPQ